MADVTRMDKIKTNIRNIISVVRKIAKGLRTIADALDRVDDAAANALGIVETKPEAKESKNNEST